MPNKKSKKTNDPPELKKKRVKAEPSEPAKSGLEEDRGPAYYPVNMDNFIYTQHLLQRYATYVISQLQPEANTANTKEALSKGEKVEYLMIKKMLKAVGANTAVIERLMTDIGNYASSNRPEQLYYRLRR